MTLGGEAQAEQPAVGGPLEGVRVLEVASYVAAPSAAAILSDLGADVMKVEPPAGDPLRGMMRAPRRGSERAVVDPGFEVDNRGKQSICIAIDDPRGADLVHRLAATVDVVVVNLLKHRQDRYGLDAKSLLAANPRLVHATMTGYGTTGPEAWRPGYDTTAFFARGAVTEFSTEPGGAPPQAGSGQGDHTAGLALVVAILAGLRHAARTGVGQAVETSLFSTALWTMASDLAPTLIDKKPRTPRDRRHALSALANRYRGKDERWLILLSPNPQSWGTFCSAIGREDLAEDVRYATPSSRFQNMPELVDALDGVFALRPVSEWGAIFDAHGLPWGPVQSVAEVVDDPQARAAGFFTSIDHPDHGPFDTVAIPVQVHGAYVGPRRRAPRLGEHTRAVLSDLGLDDTEVADLAAAGVVR